MSSNRELESLVKSQREQLIRYETRLKGKTKNIFSCLSTKNLHVSIFVLDVVTAYKGLLKEKEALEAAITSSSTTEKDSLESTSKDVPKEDLQLQISTLMNSLATLSNEKSRMEASFQADKKKLRGENADKDQVIRDLEQKLKEYGEQTQSDLDSMKSRFVSERNERERESNNSMVMVRELQKLLSDERHLRETLEIQLNDLKSDIASNSNTDENCNQLKSELKEAKSKIKKLLAENQRHQESTENNLILQQLQGEMQHLKHQHCIALKNEQMKALFAEERNKKLAILHEDRVANLESRLAELSNTVGNYDRLRQKDQDSIHKLKEKLSKLSVSQMEAKSPADRSEVDIPKAIEEILRLKKFIQAENAHLQNPIDLGEFFFQNYVSYFQALI